MADVTVARSTLASVSGCDNHYALYEPDTGASGPLVLIVPGFARDHDRMRGWGEAAAQRGMRAATMDFCSPTAFDGRHADNARDLIALGRRLDAASIVYVGHSAGGLAALLAATDDPKARGMVLLDPVEFARLGHDAAPRSRVRGVALLAEPGTCNLRGNFRSVLRQLPLVTTIPVVAATHCDFEWPPDALCRAVCDFGGPGRDRRIASEQQIRSLAFDFIESWRTAPPPSGGDGDPMPAAAPATTAPAR